MAQNTDSFAALDLGSNSFHLLIASFQDDKLRVIDRHKDMVRLAAGLDDDGLLSDEAQQRALDSLAKIANRLRGVPRSQVRIVGTNTLRAASNAGDFMQRAEAILGLPINIISGTEEARLVYLGVANDLAVEQQKRLVIDIGGGSTELVAGKQNPKLLESLPMGCVSYSMRFFSGGDISEKAFKRAVNAARQLISPYVEQYRDQWQEVVGSSGTIRAIAKIAAEMTLCDAGHITREAMQAIKAQLLTAKHSSELELAGLSDDRREVFAGGFAVLYALFKEMDINDLHTSAYAVREGIIFDLAGRFHHKDRRDETIRQLVEQYHIDPLQGERIADLCKRWLPALEPRMNSDYQEAEKLLVWAAQLHELGLAIAHGGYHKHGAYILKNADLSGFSRQEQARLSMLVLNHRRKPKTLGIAEYGAAPDWMMISLLRLACLFYRRRQAFSLSSAISLQSPEADLIQLRLPQNWLDANPLSAADLDDEADILAKTLNIRLEILPYSDA